MDRPVDFDIPAQPLDLALLEYSRQTGVQVLSSGAVVANRRAPAVQRADTPRNALTALLRGSNLSFTVAGENTVAIAAVAPRPSKGPEVAPAALQSPPLPAPSASIELAAAEPALERSVEAIIVTGTRTSGLRAVDSPAPVQVLDSTTLARTGQPDLIQALAQNMPSFTAQAFGGDTANLTLSAKLKGLSPNHALVLLNGKRRHGTANLAVLGGPYQGGASADLNFIPVAAIGHVEVLSEGAAAQYGTDAIAGVVNIFLKNSDSGGSITATGGKYFDGGGLTGDLAVNIGIAPIENMFFNLTYEAKYHDFSFRGDVDPRVINTPFNAGMAASLGSYPFLTSQPGYPYLNRQPGDAEYRLNVLAFNAGYQINEDTQIYGFGTYGRKFGQGNQYFRVPNFVIGKDGTNPRPLGFTPKDSITENDFGVTLGIEGVAGGWRYDLATTYGMDNASVNTLNSINRSLYIDSSTATTPGFSPTDFHAGDLIATQWANTLDVTHEFDWGMAKPTLLALGAEARRESYEIKAGDPGSRYKEGSQSYPGFALTDAGRHTRTEWAVYADVALFPVEPVKLDLAVRHEHFSDFGDTTVVKGTGRYDFNPAWAIRGTASTGFRAPTLAEEYYSSTNVTPTSANVQLPPNSPAARLLGIDGLKPEKSVNYSAGIVAHPIQRLSATLDVYSIAVRDRIVGTGVLYGSGGTPSIPAVRAAIIANGNILDPTVLRTGITMFTNGLNTRTNGAELILTYATVVNGMGRLDWSLSGNLTKTKVTKILEPPAELAGASLFSPSAIATLEKSSPRFKLVAGLNWRSGRFSLNLREAYYGKASGLGTRTGAVYYETVIKPALITDLELSYQVTRNVRATIGANNLFNRYPNKNNASLRAEYLAANDVAYVAQYPAFSPFGINGGFYYGKVGVSF